MPARPHILVVNGRKVRQPVFVIGAPHSGADLLARALKQAAAFHLTLGQPGVMSVVGAFARSPSIQRARPEAVAAVLRNALAEAWQVTAAGCLACLPACREAGRVSRGGTCVAGGEITRYGDASPDLIYCAEPLLDAFPDAMLIQIIRDGRDVAAAMLAGGGPSWCRPGAAAGDSEFPQPFLGIETMADLASWRGLSSAGRCAMRWRGSVRAMARLRRSLPADQLTTLRYEQVVREPAAAARAISAFVGAAVPAIPVGAPAAGPGACRRPGGAADGPRRLLTSGQLAEINRVAGPELCRVGYGG